MKEVVTSPGIGTAMLDAGSTTTIGIGGAIGISESAIMAEGGTRSSVNSSSHRATTWRPTRAPKVKAPSTRHRASRCATCTRDSKGRIARSRTATRDFQKAHPCPSTGRTTGPWKGYAIDHVVPLKRGGADAPSNMQWQTKAAAIGSERRALETALATSTAMRWSGSRRQGGWPRLAADTGHHEAGHRAGSVGPRSILPRRHDRFWRPRRVSLAG